MNEEIKAALKGISELHAGGSYGFIYDGEIYLFCHPVKTLTLSMQETLNAECIEFCVGEFAIEPSTKHGAVMGPKYREQAGFDALEYLSGFCVIWIASPKHNSTVITLLRDLLRDYISKPTPIVEKLL